MKNEKKMRVSVKAKTNRKAENNADEIARDDKEKPGEMEELLEKRKGRSNEKSLSAIGFFGASKKIWSQLQKLCIPLLCLERNFYVFL